MKSAQIHPLKNAKSQNNKPVTAQRMKRMGYLSRTQGLTESKCSSM